MTDTERRADFLAALRACADFLEAHPAVPLPISTNLNVFNLTREGLADLARLGGWEKYYDANFFALRKRFGEDLTFDLNTARGEVCRRVVTGTRIVPAQPEREVEEVEWLCDEPLLAGATQR